MINGLDLFTGIGGLSIALHEFIRPIGYCENDRFAQAVILSRMSKGRLPLAPIWDDVRTLRGDSFAPGSIDIIYGGFPCQDISVAGHGKGLVGERSGLYFEIERLVEETNPSFVFLENVPAIRTRGLNTVVQSFTELGYDCRWTVLSAQELGAPHIRKRWFLLAHAHGLRLWEKQREEHPTGQGPLQFNDDGSSQYVANPTGLTERESANEADAKPDRRQTWDEPFDCCWWKVEPNVGRVAHGVPARVDRLRGLGNAVVPLQAKTAFKRLMGLT